jgi:tRNA U34 2-thiouridine synthase MnmA/TrmU
MLNNYKNIISIFLEEYQYGKKFSLDEPSTFDKFTDTLGKKILKQPKVQKSIMTGIVTSITTNDNKKAFKNAIKVFKENDMSFSKKFILENIYKDPKKDFKPEYIDSLKKALMGGVVGTLDEI